METKGKKVYKIEDLMEIKVSQFPDCPVFIPKDYTFMNCTGIPEEMKEPWKKKI